MSKPPLVFLHGLRGNHLGLAKLAAAFPDYETYLPDLPPSTSRLQNYSAENYTNWVKNYLIKQGIKKPILIGHSMGSIIAAAVAAKYPELLGPKIIFLSAIVSRPPKPLPLLAHTLNFLPSNLADYLTTKYLFVPKNSTLFRSTLELTHHCARTTSPKSDIAKTAVFASNHTVSNYQFSQSALFVTGAKDRLNSPQKLKHLVNRLSAELIIVPDAGHLINYECPEQIAKSIRKFLEN